MTERAISGFVFVAMMLGCMYFGPWTLIGFMSLVSFGGLWEYQKLLLTNDAHFGLRRWLQMGACAALLVTFVLSSSENSLANVQSLLFVIITLAFCVELFLANDAPFKQLSIWFFGLMYVALPVVLYLDAVAQPKEPYLFLRAAAPFFLIWTNDTMAYLVGRTIGKTPFAPRISPKKTWEGTIGGGICTLVLAYFVGPMLMDLNPNEWIGVALVVAVFGTLGDLVESMLKRSVGVKDSGNIMPGHGGFLDRFDSFIFAAPLIWLVLKVL
jgi:phosphatidate cytidylyltransferase